MSYLSLNSQACVSLRRYKLTSWVLGVDRISCLLQKKRSLPLAPAVYNCGGKKLQLHVPAGGNERRAPNWCTELDLKRLLLKLTLTRICSLYAFGQEHRLDYSVVSLEMARCFAKINHFSVLVNTDNSLGFLVVERESLYFFS
jgi:hypothetical protein